MAIHTPGRWLGLLVALGALAFFGTLGSERSGDKARTLTAQAQDSRAGQLSRGPKLRVLSWGWRREYGYIRVEGEVQNISSERLNNVMVVALLRTEGGDFVKKADSLVDYNPILPGQASPFSAITTDNPAIALANVEFRYLFGGTILYEVARPRADDRGDFSREQIRNLQADLAALGYEPGPIDGMVGPRTRSAVEAFQRDRGLRADGRLTAALLQQAEGESQRPRAGRTAAMSAGEVDAVKRQIEGCWTIPQAVPGIEDMVVRLRISLEQDRSVRDVWIEDQARTAADPGYRAVAESAQRAVLTCSPLRVPPEKYQLWRELLLTFHLRDILGG